MSKEKIFIRVILCGTFFVFPPLSHADTPPAVPVTAVEAETLAGFGDALPDAELEDTPEPEPLRHSDKENISDKIMKSIFFLNQDKPDLEQTDQAQEPKIVKPVSEVPEVQEELYVGSPVVTAKQPERPDFDTLIKGAGGGPVVLELFSTQACTFCPRADALMADLVDHPSLIALSCHVDYFDVEVGSRALPVCSSRQISYEGAMKHGPKYTPQMVFNGRLNAIGYREHDVAAMLEVPIRM